MKMTLPIQPICEPKASLQLRNNSSKRRPCLSAVWADPPTRRERRRAICSWSVGYGTLSEHEESSANVAECSNLLDLKGQRVVGSLAAPHASQQSTRRPRSRVDILAMPGLKSLVSPRRGNGSGSGEIETSAPLVKKESANIVRSSVSLASLRKCDTVLALTGVLRSGSSSSSIEPLQPINRLRVSPHGSASRICSRCSSLLTLASNSRYSLNTATGGFEPVAEESPLLCKLCLAETPSKDACRIRQCNCAFCKQNSNARITSLEWINGQDVPLVMVASDDGSVRLWRPSGSREPNLVCAWQAFNELMPSYKSNLAGVLVNWEQWTQTVITSGDTRVIRLWDAQRELRAFDIPTGADCSVTCLDSTYSSVAHEKHNRSLVESDHSDDGIFMGMDNELPSFNNQKQGLIVAGCADGSVRLFDRRCPPSDCRVKTWVEHASWVLGAQLRDNKVISGSCDGDVKIFDIRKSESIAENLVTQMHDMTAFAIHRNAEIYACGSANQNISIHNMLGTNLNNIRFHEGFMGHRIGQVTCLAFHPHKVALAAGTNDCLLTIYCMESRR